MKDFVLWVASFATVSHSAGSTDPISAVVLLSLSASNSAVSSPSMSSHTTETNTQKGTNNNGRHLSPSKRRIACSNFTTTRLGFTYHFAKLVVAPGRHVGYLEYSCMLSYIRHYMEEIVQIHGTVALTPETQPLLCIEYEAG
jgi:hypothetical protein